jgi:hypothetical protein
MPLFQLVVAKKVNDVNKTEKDIHKMLTDHGRRVSARREFFRAEMDEIIEIFDSIEGEYMHNDDMHNGNADSYTRSNSSLSLTSKSKSNTANSSSTSTATSSTNSSTKSTAKAKSLYKPITNVIQDIKNESISVNTVPRSYDLNSSKWHLVTRANNLEDHCNDGDHVYHNISQPPCEWVGVYDESANRIVAYGKKYKSFAEFATAHYKSIRVS